MRLKRAGNPAITNFGYGNRDPHLAVKNLLEAHYQSYGTRAHLADRFAIFWKWITKHFPTVKDLRQLDRQHIEEYALFLAAQELTGKLLVSTTHNYLSAINQILSRARGDDKLLVRPVQDAGFRKRMRRLRQVLRRTPFVIKPMKREEQVLLILTYLQHDLGLRLEESVKLDACKALLQAEKIGWIQIVRGTKGGRRRFIEIEETVQIETLKAAAALQKSLSHCSLCPPNTSYAKFRCWCYRQLKKWGWDEAFHGNRRVYAQNRYKRKAGFPCPAALGLTKPLHRRKISEEYGLTIEQVKAQDKFARKETSLSLGHSREEIVGTYCG